MPLQTFPYKRPFYNLTLAPNEIEVSEGSEAWVQPPAIPFTRDSRGSGAGSTVTAPLNRAQWQEVTRNSNLESPALAIQAASPSTLFAHPTPGGPGAHNQQYQAAPSQILPATQWWRQRQPGI
jgi:hypothetical protein